MEEQLPPPQTLSDAEMVQCEVTGLMVPASETVEFRGYRVSAQGKAELLERLKAGEVMPGEMERPSVGRRFGGMFLDNLLLGVIGVVLGALLVGATLFTAGAGGAASPTFGAGTMVVAFINIGFSLAYFGFLHGTRGQTLGKMVAKTKVVRMDGTPINMKVALLRITYLSAPQWIAGILSGFGMMASNTVLITISQILNVLGILYVIAGVIVALVDSKSQRAIHDLLAGTRVIQLD